MFKTTKKSILDDSTILNHRFFILQPPSSSIFSGKTTSFHLFPTCFPGTSHVFPWNVRRLPGRQRRVAEDQATLQGALRVGGALCGGAVLGEEDLAAHLADAVFLLGVCVYVYIYM